MEWSPTLGLKSAPAVASAQPIRLRGERGLASTAGTVCQAAFDLGKGSRGAWKGMTGGLQTRHSLRSYLNLPVTFSHLHGAKAGVLARAADAAALVAFEYGAVGGADQVAFIVSQELIRRPVQRSALVRADVQPGAYFTLVPGQDQKSGLVVSFHPGLAKLAFGQVVGLAQELGFVQAVFLKWTHVGNDSTSRPRVRWLAWGWCCWGLAFWL